MTALPAAAGASRWTHMQVGQQAIHAPRWGSGGRRRTVVECRCPLSLSPSPASAVKSGKHDIVIATCLSNMDCGQTAKI